MREIDMLGAVGASDMIFVDAGTVKAVQQAIHDLPGGSAMKVDGKIGPITRAGVKAFNEAHGFSGEDITEATLGVLALNPLDSPVAKSSPQHEAAKMAAKSAPALTPETTIKLEKVAEDEGFFSWFSKRSIISAVPNGVIAGGVVGVVAILTGILLSKKDSMPSPVPAGV
jgi:peptidoglycan hydrolase-like protein with peptidoglycan-binding domain